MSVFVIDGDMNSMSFDIAATMDHMKQGGDQFAVATVVRTVSVTAAKPGAKAIINAEGEICLLYTSPSPRD